MASRKDIAQDLDRAAARAETMGRKPATAKQCWYLAGLMEAAGDDAASIGCGISNFSAMLTSVQASNYISDYKGESAWAKMKAGAEQVGEVQTQVDAEQARYEAEEAARNKAATGSIKDAVAAHPELVAEYKAAYAETESRSKNSRKKARQKLIERMREAFGQPGLQHYHLQ